ncbi:MAG: beta-lactamase family protein [Bacteroidales bacterium]|nr:beta-lactamase family protein [Bacteroidales bacterium]
MKFYLIILGAILLGCTDATSFKSDISEQDSLSIKSHESLLKFKQDNKIEGLAFAIFNNKETLFKDCAGRSTYSFKINEETLFSIQSISKNITALALLIAVQDGLLDLDVPVAEYLPCFKVNSCFEEEPEQKMTLRMLLSHTAGFTHEAPVGNNYDYRTCSKQDHFNSIMNTWLKFPAGKSYSYSNLGFDVAATIISQKSGLSFNEYLKQKIFHPLGMLCSTTDDQEIKATQNKTEGNISWVKSKHHSIPLIGSGAVYTNLNELISYVQLLMNYGQTGNKPLIERKYILEMAKINTVNYGLGTYIDKSDDVLFIGHNGGGYGYSATILWFPEYNLGSLILCNGPSNTFDFCFSLMEDYIQAMDLPINTSISAEFDMINGDYFKNKTDNEQPVFSSCKCDTTFKTDWDEYTGKYSIVYEGMDFKWYVKAANFLGFGYQNIYITRDGQALKYTGTFGEGTLQEFEPGLFFTDDFEALDFKPEIPTFRNIKIRKRNN